MKKTNVLWLILDLVFLVIFNAIFFMVSGFNHKESVWISYGFIHFAYIMLLITPMLIKRGKSTAVFSFSLYSVSLMYFFIELVAGVMFILIKPDSYKAALLIQLVIAGLYAVALISNMVVNESTADAEEIRSHQIDFVKKASAQLKSLLDSISEKEVKKKVEKVCDMLYLSPVKSHPSLEQTETCILMSINELGCAVSEGSKEQIVSLANTLLVAVNERNRQLKMLN